MPLPNFQKPNEFFKVENGDVTINTITKVEYRINGGAWVDAQPVDGAFDSAEEGFSFTTPALKDGKYQVEVKATNSVGNQEIHYAKDELTITGSHVLNVAPFASFTIKPARGSIYANFIFDASSSTDLEDVSANLQVRWDFENDGIWDTAFSTAKTTSFRYAAPGMKTIKIQVRDSQGLTQTATRQICVAGYNLAPEAFFTATPENQHGLLSNNFSVTLDARNTYDDENGIGFPKVRWDFENDGIWDTAYSDNLQIQHTYTLPMSLPIIGSYLTGGRSRCFRNVALSGNSAYFTDYFAQQDGLTIIDITNPRGLLKNQGYYKQTSVRDLAISENYAYLLVNNPYKLQIVNIANPKTPFLAGNYSVNAKSIIVNGPYAYLATANGMQVIDVSNPSSPTLVSQYNTQNAGGLFISGNYAYLSTLNQGLLVIDISNPRVPVLVGNYKTTAKIQSVFIEGGYAYLATTDQGLLIINISNPKVPSLEGVYQTAFPMESVDVSLLFSPTHRVFVTGRYAYLATGNEGMKVVDISDPHAPFLAATYYVPSCFCLGVSVAGNYAYIADYNDDLRVVDISYPFKMGVAPMSKNYKVKMEAIDGEGNISTATRDIWVNTYNHPPSVGRITIETISPTDVKLTAVGINDPDFTSKWDRWLGLRWDFENDGTWDTKFNGIKLSSISTAPFDISIIIPKDHLGVFVTAQARDTFGATKTVTYSVLVAPSRLTATPVSPYAVKLEWEDNSDNEEFFEIEQSTDGGKTFIPAGGLVRANTTNINRAALPDTEYRYRIRAVKGTEKSAYSNLAIVETPAVTRPPAPPEYVEARAMPSQGQIRIKWLYTTNKITAVEGVKIYRSTDGRKFIQIAVLGKIGEYLDKNLKAGTRYYYKIVVYNKAGDSAYSRMVSAVTIPRWFLSPKQPYRLLKI